MKLLLQKKVPGLGDMGDVVDVSDGYGRNYLLPQRYAVANTPENRLSMESEKLVVLQREAERHEIAAAAGKQLEKARLTVHMRAQEDGTLYGSVSTAVIVEAIEKAKGLRLEERWVALESPIKRIGDYDIHLKLPDDKEATFKLTVLPEGE